MVKHFPEICSLLDPNITEWDDPTERYFNGKIVKGRPTRGFGEAEFNYAGRVYKPEPWSKEILDIKQAAENIAYLSLHKQIEFNFCLCGYYSERGEGIPHHSDTVPTEDDVVVSISFGDTRVFEWIEYSKKIKSSTNTSEIDVRYKDKKDTRLYLLKHGDVLIFDGKSQLTSTHAIPDVIGGKERINITFRSGI